MEKKNITNLRALFLVMMLSGNVVAKNLLTNQLNKVYYHELTNRRQDNPSYNMELGKVVLYFDQNFDMSQSKRTSDKDNDIIVFHFPKTIVKSAECKQMISELNKKKFPLYAFNIQADDSKGMNFSITFKPQDIEISVLSFDSIGLQKGLAINVFNKKLLDDLAGKVNPVLRTACLEKKLQVVIDCGHGGQDVGTISSMGIKEKDISLQIGIKLAQFLNERGVVTNLTRSDDRAIALDARTYYANNCNADLLVSIHANNSSNIQASGVETFYLKPTLFSQKFATYDQKKKSIVDMAYENLSEQSVKLAQAIHGNVIIAGKKINTTILDRSVKSSVTQVLMGSTMPSALIEVGFLSNPREAELLVNSGYQSCLASGIGQGILSYLGRQS